jgi:short-subunit dehydrogenase
VTTEDGRATTLATGRPALGGIHILIDAAGGVRAGRLEDITEAEILAMIAVDLTAPILPGERFLGLRPALEAAVRICLDRYTPLEQS